MADEVTLTPREILQAAAGVILDPVLRLIQNDPHSWSTRPCETCRAVTSILGKTFGCYEYTRQKQERP